MKKLMNIILICLCIFLISCKKDPDGSSHVRIIPTIKISEPNEIWASDIYIRPEDVTESVREVRIEAGTKLGDWVCPVTRIYKYEEIKDYLP